MKNAFKVGALALVIAVSFAACKGKGSAAATDSPKTDSPKMAADSPKMKMDSPKMAADTTKKDTTKMKK